MKVVLATHRTNQWLGVNKYFYLLGKYLAELGVDVLVIVDSAEGIFRGYQSVGDETVGIGIKWEPPTATNQISTLRYCRNLCRYFRKIRF